MWERIKAFFKESETLVWARLQMLIGFIGAAASAMDWGPLIGLAQGGDFTQKQMVSLGIVLFVQGAATEITRRLRTKPGTLLEPSD